MNIYDELTDELIEDEPDLTTGYIYKGKRISVHHDAVDPVIKIDILPGAESCNDGNGLRGPIEVSPGTPAWDEYEDCMYYHKYTSEEVEEKRGQKLKELSSSCNFSINFGSDVKLEDGTTKHFAYTIEDQSNISEMFNAIIMGATSYPYHADGEACRMYSAKDITAIYVTLSSLKTSQTTYHNMLKQYVMTLNKVPDIESVEYGQELAGEYIENYNRMLDAANEQMQIVLSKVSQSFM